MAVSFKVEPRHVQMFGAQGILAPLYQRQAQKMALTEQQRQEQAQFEQMKALKQLQADLERPFREAQIEAQKAQTAYYQERLPGVQAEVEREQGRNQAISDFAVATTQEEKDDAARRIIAYSGGVQGLLEQQPQEYEYPVISAEGEELRRIRSTGRPIELGYPSAALLRQQQQPTGLTFEQKRGLRKDITGDIKFLFGAKDIIPGRLAKELGIEKQPIDQYLSTFSGKAWSPEQVRQAEILRASDNPIAKTMSGILDRLWDIEMSDVGPAEMDTTQVQPGATGWQQWIQSQVPVEGQVGGGASVPQIQGAPAEQQLISPGIHVPTPEQLWQYRAAQQQRAGVKEALTDEEREEQRRRSEEAWRLLNTLRYYQLRGKVLGG